MTSKTNRAVAAYSYAARWRSAHMPHVILAVCGSAILVLALFLFPLTGYEFQLLTLICSCVTLLIACMLHRTVRHVPPLLPPLILSLAFSLHFTVSASAAAHAQGTDFALLFGLLAAFVSVFAPGRHAAVVALGAMWVVALVGGLVIATSHPAFALISAFSGVAVATAVGVLIAHVVEESHREADLLRHELARRATSDDITGVSNRAHILLLAQNEFARARRYGEPCSCLMIAIDDYDNMVAQHGPLAVDTIVQVLTGYCVVVMRHCDSLGRLAPARFLALLPETPEAGATTLANRMCRDLAALNVAFAGNTLKFTISIGGAQLHAVDRSAGDLLRRAEQGLLDTGERGGNMAIFAPVPAAPLTDGTPHDGAAL